jgi:GAF domain-containing protein
LRRGRSPPARGPCHDAYLSGDRVTVADLAADDRWPRYRPITLEQNFRAVADIPMIAGDQRIGALNLYHDSPREWPADDLDIAQVLADMTTGYVINARALSAHRELTSQLQHALDGRIVVEQAKGILAVRHRTDPARAFQTLRTHARTHNAKLQEVARGVIDGSLQL